MAIILSVRDYQYANKESLHQPVIWCRPDLELFRNAAPMNVPLANALLSVKPNRRTMRLEQCFSQVLKSLPDDPVICNIDVLFNPAYEADILRIMESVGKTKRFQIIWPGKYEAGRLIYAEEGCPDYKVFDLDNYGVTCVI